MFLIKPPTPTHRVVDSIIFTPEVNNDREVNQESRHRRSYLSARRLSKITGSYIDTVIKRVEIMNDAMAKKGLSFRYRTRIENNELLLDMLILDRDGKISRQHTRTVTRDNFGSLLDVMSSGEGFLFDD